MTEVVIDVPVGEIQAKKVHTEEKTSDKDCCCICLDEKSPLINKNTMFGCNCNLYYHEHCWKSFVESSPNVMCPYCRKEMLNRQPSWQLPHYVNIATTILLSCIMYGSFILFIVGLSQISTKDDYFTEVVVISVSMCSMVFFSILFACLETYFPDWWQRIGKKISHVYVVVMNFYNVFLVVYMHVSVYKGHLNNYIFTLVATCMFLSLLYGMVIVLVIFVLIQNGRAQRPVVRE